VTGAGHLDDEDVSALEKYAEMDEDDWADLENGIEEAQAGNFHDKIIPVPKLINPFHNQQEVEDIFVAALQEVEEAGIIPSGYGLLPEEWDDEAYPNYEMLKSGRCRKDLRVSLPDFIWRQRAEVWAQALHIYNYLSYMFES
jgi:hypothetical protein